MKKNLVYVIMILPGLLAMLGIDWMRDALFLEFHTTIESVIFQLILGFLFFLGGTFFIAGYINHRDKMKSELEKFSPIPNQK